LKSCNQTFFECGGQPLFYSFFSNLSREPALPDDLSRDCNRGHVFVTKMTKSCHLFAGVALNKFPPMKISPKKIAKAGRFAASVLAVFALTLRVQAQDTNFNFQAAQAAAEQGDAKSQYELSRCYANGIGVDLDYAKAVQYLRQSAGQGYAVAQLELGYCYGRGLGVPKNVATAVQWYRKAADQGNALAQYAMGGFYATGRGVTNDMDEAVKWWQKAAGQDQVDAEAKLGELHLIPAAPYGTNYLNYAEALKWLHKAAAQGSAGAMNNLGVSMRMGLARWWILRRRPDGIARLPSREMIRVRPT
jgi:TPR repeat protein